MPRISKRKFEIKNKKNFDLKNAYFLGHPNSANSGSWSQNASTFLQNIHLFTKYWDPKKISLFTSLFAEINGGGGRSFCLAKGLVNQPINFFLMNEWSMNINWFTSTMAIAYLATTTHLMKLICSFLVGCLTSHYYNVNEPLWSTSATMSSSFFWVRCLPSHYYTVDILLLPCLAVPSELVAYLATTTQFMNLHLIYFCHHV